MNTIVQTNTTAKPSLPRRSRFPGKESGSVSFNLTAIGRQLLKDQAAEAKVSNGDYVEMLIRERDGKPPLKIASTAKQTGPKGGAKSYFFGKNRGTTTAVCVTPMAHRMLDAQVLESRMSRGDYVEYLLRLKGEILEDHLKTTEEECTSSECSTTGEAWGGMLASVVEENPSITAITSEQVNTAVEVTSEQTPTETDLAPVETDKTTNVAPMPSTATNFFSNGNW